MRTLRSGSEKNPYEKTHFREIAKIVVWKALALSLTLTLLPSLTIVIVLSTICTCKTLIGNY